MSRAAQVALTTVALTVLLSLSGCGGKEEAPPPTGPFADALADIGGGYRDGGTLGVGWADPRLVERIGAGDPLIADALGPNAGSVVEAARQLRRRFGLDPLSARQLISVGGSYAYGLRIEGPDGRQLGRALVAAGGRGRSSAGLNLIDIGEYAVVPELLQELEIRGLGARDAFGPGLAVLAISDPARTTLLGRGNRLLDQPTYRAAADCLGGEVVAVRMISDNHLLSVEQGIDLLAAGVTAGREVLCVLGGTADRAAEVASGLETAVAPDSDEPGVSEGTVGDSVAAVEVTSSPYEGVEVVRAELTLELGEPRGFLFRTIATGRLVALINGGCRSGEVALVCGAYDDVGSD